MKQLRRILDVTNLKLQALDGEVGGVQELYIDSRTWSVRYLVVETGGWFLGREVLIAPVAVSGIDDGERIMRLNLTKTQIEQAPPVDKAKPPTREYEEAYYRHFNWSPYWQPGAATLGSSLPYPAAPSLNLDAALLSESPGHPHLRSSRDMTGCGIHTQDGEIGHVEDLVIDDGEWLVRYMEVDTRNWLPGKKVLVQTGRIDRVHWARRMVTVALTRHTIRIRTGIRFVAAHHAGIRSSSVQTLWKRSGVKYRRESRESRRGNFVSEPDRRSLFHDDPPRNNPRSAPS